MAQVPRPQASENSLVYHLDVSRNPYVDASMARLTGFFQSGAHYLRVFLPHDHPRMASNRNGGFVLTLPLEKRVPCKVVQFRQGRRKRQNHQGRAGWGQLTQRYSTKSRPIGKVG